MVDGNGSGLSPPVSGDAAHEFVGRTQELIEIVARTNTARGGSPQVVLIVGEPGIGKSALVRRVVEPLSEATTTHHVAGDIDEQDLSFGVADQLMKKLSRRPVEPSDGAEAAVVGRMLVDTLAEGLGDSGAVLVLEDAHWMDATSLHALSFALRRLENEPLLVLITCRPEGLARLPEGITRLASGQTGTVIDLPGLSADEIRALARRGGLGDLSQHSSERLRQHTQGSPLHVRMVLDETDGAALHDPRDVPLRAPASVREEIERRVEALPADATAVVQAAAVLHAHAPLAQLASLVEVPDLYEALDPAREAGLLDVHDLGSGPVVTFEHPLFRSATYEAITLVDRARLHLAAAEVVDGRAALRHRVAAASGYDDDLASAMLMQALDDAAAHSWWSAAEAWISVSRLQSDRTTSASSVAVAVGCLLLAGDVAAARQMASLLIDGAASAVRSLVLGGLATADRRFTDALELFEEAWTLRDPEDLSTAAQIAEQIGGVYRQQLRHTQALEWGHRSVELLAAYPHGQGIDPLTSLLLAYANAGRAWEGLAMLEARPDLMAEVSGGIVPGLLGRAVLRVYTDDPEGAIGDFESVAKRARVHGPMMVWCAAEVYLAVTYVTLGRFDDAYRATLRAMSAGDIGHDMQCFAQSSATLILATQGARAEAHAALELTRAAAAEIGAAPAASYVLALAEVNEAMFRNDPAGVVSALAECSPAELVELLSPQPLARSLAEALLYLGRWEEAEAQVARLETMAAQLSTGTKAVVAALRGALSLIKGDPAVARASFDEALALTGNRLPLDRGHVLFLRAHGVRSSGGDPAVAEQLLADARRQFLGLGALGWVARCDWVGRGDETGRADHERDPLDDDTDPPLPEPEPGLTPTERVVARLVAEGRTNREAASELVVSVRTIESHLSRIYSKLAVTNRTQLALKMSGAVMPKGEGETLTWRA